MNTNLLESIKIIYSVDIISDIANKIPLSSLLKLSKFVLAIFFLWFFRRIFFKLGGKNCLIDSDFPKKYESYEFFKNKEFSLLNYYNKVSELVRGMIKKVFFILLISSAIHFSGIYEIQILIIMAVGVFNILLVLVWAYFFHRKRRISNNFKIMGANSDELFNKFFSKLTPVLKGELKSHLIGKEEMKKCKVKKCQDELHKIIATRNAHKELVSNVLGFNWCIVCSSIMSYQINENKEKTNGSCKKNCLQLFFKLCYIQEGLFQKSIQQLS